MFSAIGTNFSTNLHDDNDHVYRYRLISIRLISVLISILISVGVLGMTWRTWRTILVADGKRWIGGPSA